MLRKVLMATGLVGLLGFGGFAFAGNGYTYLGGAVSLPDCQVRAGAQGYAVAVFGPGYDNYGRYYPFWNACFGYGNRGGDNDNGGRYSFYEVRVRDGYDLNQCAQDIEWRVQSSDCRVESRDYVINCKTRGDHERDIESVNCVRRVLRD